MHSLKLIYFKMRALAEAPQMLMKFADLNYEYLMSWDYFDDDWEMVKPTIPFQQLPILIVDGEHQIAQSTSIMRFLQRLAGMEPQDPVVAAKADAILESAQELFRPLNPTVNFAVGEDFESKKESMLPELSSRFADLERALLNGGEQFFMGEKPIACDFTVYHHLDISRNLDPDFLGQFSRLSEFVRDIERIESVSDYLNSRPELIDVKVAPKLVINGKAHPTGINKT